jgi:hypothetical protein
MFGLGKKKGPDGPESEVQVTLMESITNYKSNGSDTVSTKSKKQFRWHMQEGMDLHQLTITPSLASEMLEYNDRNRPVSQSRVARYADEMRVGHWHYTRVPIIFSNERLIDGQHRLLACLDAGVAFVADVAFGADDAAFYYIDVGGTRTAGDIFAINGVPNFSMAAAATRFLMAYDAERHTGTQNALGSDRPNLQEVYEAYLGYERLQDSIKLGQSFAQDRLPAPSVAAAVHYLCAQKARGQANEYFGKIASGIGFTSRRDPAYKVREYLIRPDETIVRRDVAAALIQGWNAVRTRKPLGKIKVGKIDRVQ